MFIDAVGLIFADEKKIQLGELPLPRALAAVPFGGRYRIIDFMLSNMVNTGIKNIGVSTFNKYKSLMDHLGTGSPWDLDRKSPGLSILTPYLISDTYNGLNDLSAIINFLRFSKRKHVVIGGSSVFFNLQFNQMVDSHEQSGADITLLFSKETTDFEEPNIVLEFDRKNKLKGFLLNPKNLSGMRKCFMDVMVIERELLLSILQDNLSRGVAGVDFISFMQLNDSLNIRGYEFKGMAMRIHSVHGYFAATMKTLTPAGRKAVFGSDQPVYTKVKDESPTYYSNESRVVSCMISDGCVIEGDLKDSLLFRGVTVASGAKLRNCIIFQNSFIGENCNLENCIIDKNVHIKPGITLTGQEAYPVVVGKGAIV
jgi:hypothetical protein